jgi:hypothetical protein
MQKLKETVENCLSSLKVDKSQGKIEKPSKANGPISLWVPKEYKEDYDKIQALTDRQFGKLLQEVVKKAIDSAK